MARGTRCRGRGGTILFENDADRLRRPVNSVQSHLRHISIGRGTQRVLLSICPVAIIENSDHVNRVLVADKSNSARQTRMHCRLRLSRSLLPTCSLSDVSRFLATLILDVYDFLSIYLFVFLFYDYALYKFTNYLLTYLRHDGVKKVCATELYL